ncbi:hypothetical protein BDM02DRAFT_1515285 [Thelephora ganbajun]|uniref:Uncharacterized protein n=1 Tax=Thelephora ganbajun TaxID=370292 RepID=A0ACB6ZL49_THEGA|nr:hypothetical protein BDM02DRAFT_1515285 [Thelephora ganbajun]
MMVLLYDWVLILPQEIKYIWRASWKYTKVLYILTRYLPFAGLGLMLRNQFASDPTPDSCRRTLRAVCWTSVVGMDLAEIVLAVRTYAVWNEDKRVGVGLAILLTLCQIPNGIIAEKFIGGIGFIQNPYPGIYRGCVAISATKIVFANWVVFTVLEGVVLILMVISALRTYRKHKSNFLSVIYMDGIRFYLYMFCVTVVNILIILILPIDFIGVGSSIEIVLHSNLACRLVVGLREASRSPGYKLEALELSETLGDGTVVFARTNRRGSSGESVWMDLEAPPEPPKP